jgi:predicted RND superfamily exporter protein
MELEKLKPKNKTGGVVTTTVMGVGGLIIGVIVILVITSTLLTANLLGTTNSTLDNSSANITAWNMMNNFTKGINNISEKIPTILLIVAVVFLFGALVLLVRNAQAMGVGGGGSL